MAHEYPVTLEWAGGRDGQGSLTLQTGPQEVRVDTALGGPGGGTNPEELLTAAVVACYGITFGIITANKRLPVESVTVSAVGVLEGQMASLKFASLRLHPTIRLKGATPEQREQVEQAAHRAEQLCLISNAIRGNVEISVEPRIEEV